MSSATTRGRGHKHGTEHHTSAEAQDEDEEGTQAGEQQKTTPTSKDTAWSSPHAPASTAAVQTSLFWYVGFGIEHA